VIHLDGVAGAASQVCGRAWRGAGRKVSLLITLSIDAFDIVIKWRRWCETTLHVCVSQCYYLGLHDQVRVGLWGMQRADGYRKLTIPVSAGKRADAVFV